MNVRHGKGGRVGVSDGGGGIENRGLGAGIDGFGGKLPGWEGLGRVVWLIGGEWSAVHGFKELLTVGKYVSS